MGEEEREGGKNMDRTKIVEHRIHGPEKNESLKLGRGKNLELIHNAMNSDSKEKINKKESIEESKESKARQEDVRIEVENEIVTPLTRNGRQYSESFILKNFK